MLQSIFRRHLRLPSRQRWVQPHCPPYFPLRRGTFAPSGVQLHTIDLKHIFYRFTQRQNFFGANLECFIFPVVILQKLLSRHLKRPRDVVDVYQIIILPSIRKSQPLPALDGFLTQVSNFGPLVIGAIGIRKHQSDRSHQSGIGIIRQQVGKGLLCGGI